MCLEGGYHTSATAESVAAVVSVLAGGEAPSPALDSLAAKPGAPLPAPVPVAPPDADMEAAMDALVQRLCQIHGL